MELESSNALSRLIGSDARSVSIVDLLAVALCQKESDIEHTEQAARNLLKRFPGARLLDIGNIDLLESAGFEGLDSARFHATLELGRRLSGLSKQLNETVLSPEAAYQVFQWLADEPQEHFCIACLNTKGYLICTKVLHVGTLDASIVGPRDVFRSAVRENAAMLILAHNHPSGDPTPSPEDIALTRKLKSLGEMLEIRVVDHVIIGHDGKYVSLNRTGDLR